MYSAEGGGVESNMTKEELEALEAKKGRANKEDNSKDASNSMPLIKDSSPSLLNLEAIKAVPDLSSLRAQPKDPSQDAKAYSC